MNKIKTFIRRYFILSKRLLKKPAFIIILLLVPLLVAATAIISKEGDSGIMTIALAMEDEEDPIASEIVEKLTEEKSLIRFELCKTPESAERRVKSGKADAAWIFRDNIEERIKEFVNLSHTINASVTVVQREIENVSLRLSHEKLNEALYPYIAKALYRQTLNGSSIDLSELSPEELDEFYDKMEVEGADLFEFVYANTALSDKSEEEDSSFIISPIKGLLAIMILLAGVAVSMFYMNDEARGAFDRLPKGTGFSFSLIYHMAAVFMVGVVAYITMAATGMADEWYELPILLIYCICTTGFCMCLRLLIRDMRLFGTIAPLLIVVTAVLCPIFISAPKVHIVQIFLPTFHYMTVYTNKAFILYMSIYSVLLYVAAFFLHSLKLKQIK